MGCRLSWLQRWAGLLGLAALLVGCVDGGGAPDAASQRLAISVAPLTLSGVTNARYRLVITNGSGQIVSDNTLSADAYGDGAGSLSYVTPCDAADNDNTVALTLLDLYEHDSATPISPATYNNPGTLTRQVTCLADADVAVSFDLTIVRQADQGFFDIAVEFDQLFCSAKLDCLRDASDANSTIELLHNGTGRGRTFVLGFACTGGLGASVETWQYLDDVHIACGPDEVAVDVGAGPGSLPASAIAQVSGTHNPLFGAAVFQGEEALGGYHKQYWNVALGFNGGADCRLTTLGTASDGELNASTTPAGTTWPLLEWDVNLTDASGAQVCTQHPVNAATCPNAGVCVGYTPLDTPEAFDNAFYAASLSEYVAQTFTLSPCGQTGASGPDQAACDATYQGTSLAGEITVTSGYQRWTVPSTGKYRITARGAQGGSTGTSLASVGGYGAEVAGEFNLNAGDELIMLVGQQGTDKPGCSDWGGGGGGGTFVARRVSTGTGDALTPLSIDVTSLIIAGGGAGANDDMSGCNGQTRGEFDALASTSGTGGGGSGGGEGGGGGGYSGDGSAGHGSVGYAFLSGGAGGVNGSPYPGGFGGGGGPWNTGGGGGGYTGGSLDAYGQNGGYSFNNGANGSGSDGAHAGPGEIVIEQIMGGGARQVSGALTEADPGRWSDGSVAVSCDAYLHPATGYTAATSDGVYVIDPDGSGASFGELSVYCDMTTDGGGWTLVEVGLDNNSANIRTDVAVNSVTSTSPAASGKLSRAAIAAVAASGASELRYGHPNYGYIYLADMPSNTFDPGFGTTGYGGYQTTPVASLSWHGTTSSTTLFDWPVDGVPEVCSNIGVSGECGATLHLGTWSGVPQDGVYMNDSTLLSGQHTHIYFELWTK